MNLDKAEHFESVQFQGLHFVKSRFNLSYKIFLPQPVIKDLMKIDSITGMTLFISVTSQVTVAACRVAGLRSGKHTHKQTGTLSWTPKLVLIHNLFECPTEPAYQFVCMFSASQPCYSSCGNCHLTVRDLYLFAKPTKWRGAASKRLLAAGNITTCQRRNCSLSSGVHIARSKTWRRSARRFQRKIIVLKVSPSPFSAFFQISLFSNKRQ